ncbi:uracil-DNA glycosylase [Mycoplasmopsis glycophila]|uniref:Uracil-DNA glycosylase n=1 Tax=Mycoplasmopsis glycophila TaxID=171285 RepID=A0A449AVW8_9BACT|nr:uracil-DNA glycosylase [Mycoplasmopsis glycophila]VEU70731.1 uracil-DNA glycosylase [Mycoplasmopsis glycophila]
MKDSFLQILQKEGNKEYFVKILDSLKTAEKNGAIYPHQIEMFRPLEFFQVNETKVVILGQDPYHSPFVADGLAFSAKHTNKTPASLANLFKELKKDYPKTKIETNDLAAWAKQGVLLINMVWTVTEGKANSHKNFGWQKFTLAILEEVKNTNPNVIFVALGNEAQKFLNKIHPNPDNVIALSHPSPLGYAKSLKDGQLFLQINQKLKKHKEKQIKWDLVKEKGAK